MQEGKQYEDSGMLTDELMAQLDMQRAIVEQYEIQDKMAVLIPTSQEYIDLFKKSAEYDKKIIELSQKLKQKYENIVGICANFNTQKTNVILGKNTQNIMGQSFYTEKLGDKIYQISAQSFFQTNIFLLTFL